MAKGETNKTVLKNILQQLFDFASPLCRYIFAPIIVGLVLGYKTEILEFTVKVFSKQDIASPVEVPAPPSQEKPTLHPPTPEIVAPQPPALKDPPDPASGPGQGAANIPPEPKPPLTEKKTLPEPPSPRQPQPRPEPKRAVTVPPARPRNVDPVAPQSMTPVKIRTVPDTAKIFIDGKFSGSAPATLLIPRGSHTIRCSHTGFRDIESNIEVLELMEYPLHFTLQPAN